MDKKLNHSDLSTLLSKESELSLAKAELFTKNFFDIIIEGLEKEGIVKINGLGTFKVIDVASRSSVNVNTGEKFEIKGHRKIAFLPADTLKNKVNQPFAMFEPVEVTDDYVDSDSLLTEEIAEDGNEIVLESSESIVEKQSTEYAEESSLQATENESAEVEQPVTANETVEEISEAVEESIPETVEEPVAETEEPVAETAEEPIVETTEKTAVETEEKSAKKVKKNRKGGIKILLTIVFTLFILLAVGAVAYLLPKESLQKKDDRIIQKSLAAVSKSAIEPAEVETLSVEEIDEEQQIISAIDSSEIDSQQEIKDVAEPATEETFVLATALAQRSLSSITQGDTTIYRMVGDIASHRVSANETLTRIALKYYNDKRLWPYIVHYNKMGNHNQLEIGMILKIPRLTIK